MCEHRRLKKNFYFGRNSQPRMFCKDCGEVVTPHDRIVEKERRKKQKWK